MPHQSPNKSRSSRCNAEAEGGYKVGPGCPPKEHQFKPGQSGNPNGAKRKEPLLAAEMKTAFEAAFKKTVKLKQGDRERIVSMWAAGCGQLATQFAKGDRHARRDALLYAEKLGIDLNPPDPTQEGLPPEHQAILGDYVDRQYDKLFQPKPVFAPPELLDDDADDEER